MNILTDDDGETTVLAKGFGVAIVIGLLSLGMYRGEWVSNDVALKAVSDEGYTQAQITERHSILAAWYGCDEKDAACFKVTAKNSQGKPVKLVVCAGFVFKAVTVRHE